MKHTVSMFVVLALLWWVLSGFAKPLLLSFGFIGVLFTLFIAHRMDVIDDETHPMHLSTKLLSYWAYLMKEILVSNIQMVRTILSAKPDVNPRIFTITTTQNTELGKVVLGNSITLTPGTVTLRISDNKLEIHALNASAASGVESGDMDKRVPQGIEVQS